MIKEQVNTAHTLEQAAKDIADIIGLLVGAQCALLNGDERAARHIVVPISWAKEKLDALDGLFRS